MANQYSGPESISYSQTGNYPARADETAHYLKKIYHELKRANRISELELYIRFAEIAHEREGAFGCDCASMLRELEAGRALQKPKRKKQSKTFWEGLW